MTPTRQDNDRPYAPRVGLMADSHGEATRIDAAAMYLKSSGCTLLVHLGDIGDTVRPETATACLDQLTAHGILAVRGNNDHTILQNRSPQVSPQALAAIRDMPLTREVGSAMLAHSLPFASAMGPRCMLEDMRPEHVRLFFDKFPGRQLFRGHSHQPEIISPRGASLERVKLRPGRRYALGTGQSAVITCGALTAGLCLIWDGTQETIEPVRLADLHPASEPVD